MGDISLLFQPPQHRSHRRILQLSRPMLRQQVAQRVGRQAIVAPHELHDLAFEIAKFGRGSLHGRYFL